MVVVVLVDVEVVEEDPEHDVPEHALFMFCAVEFIVAVSPDPPDVPDVLVDVDPEQEEPEHEEDPPELIF